MSVSASEARERRLRRRARRFWPLAEMALTLPGAPHPYYIARPAFPESLLDELAARPARAHIAAAMRLPSASGHPLLRAAATEAARKVDSGGHMPYWGLIWPSGLALAEELLRAAPVGASGTDGGASGVGASGGRITSVRALELGCGLGVTAIAAQAAGLSLTAADCFPEALAFCRYNSQHNLGWAPTTLLVDWRTATGRDALTLASPYDVLLAADVLYEEPDIALLLELAPRLVKSGGRFWLAEPGRRISLTFVEAALARGWKDTPTVAERVWPPDGDYARVTIHQFAFV